MARRGGWNSGQPEYIVVGAAGVEREWVPGSLEALGGQAVCKGEMVSRGGLG